MLGLGVGTRTEEEFHFSPTDISNLALWLKNGVGVAVEQWDDSSGNDYHATQGTADEQAALSGGGLDFDGTDDSYTIVVPAPDLKIIMSANHNIAVGVVFYADAANARNFLADSNSEFFQIETTKKIKIKMGGTITRMTNTGGTNLFDSAAGVQSLVITRLDGSTGTWKMYRNGIDVEDLSGFSAWLNQANPKQIDFDILGGGVSNGYFDGKIYEVVVYDLGTGTLTTQEVTDLNDYLTGKFGIGDQHAL